MHQHAANAVATTPAPTTAPANPPPVAVAEAPAMRMPTEQGSLKENWNRVTIRLPVGELAKINDVVIATQQAIRSGKVTTTDILRIGLRRIREQEAISATEIRALRTRIAKGKIV